MAAPPLTRPAPPFLASPMRQRALEFLMDASLRLAVTPVVKYTALSLFAHRFLPTLPREVSRFGELLSFGACMDIMDLLYEREETSSFYNHPHLLAASILIAAYVLSVKKQQWEFPLLPWVKFATSCEEERIAGLVKRILEHVLIPTAVLESSTDVTIPSSNYQLEAENMDL